jgi:hypothetical protein
MTIKELQHLSKEESQTILCDFYNEIDKIFFDNNQSEDKITLFQKYLPLSRKVLQQIKK